MHRLGAAQQELAEASFADYHNAVDARFGDLLQCSSRRGGLPAAEAMRCDNGQLSKVLE
jgi:hypothetical protein